MLEFRFPVVGGVIAQRKLVQDEPDRGPMHGPVRLNGDRLQVCFQRMDAKAGPFHDVGECWLNSLPPRIENASFHGLAQQIRVPSIRSLARYCVRSGGVAAFAGGETPLALFEQSIVIAWSFWKPLCDNCAGRGLDIPVGAAFRRHDNSISTFRGYGLPAQLTCISGYRLSFMTMPKRRPSVTLSYILIIVCLLHMQRHCVEIANVPSSDAKGTEK